MRNIGKYANFYHITPEQGLLNDPNGLCFFKGYWHVFYQYNPKATDHSLKCWGHLRTKDMLNWEQLPIALEPTDWFDQKGVYSGSAIVHENQLYLFYTGNTKDSNGIRTSYQCMASSEDGIHFKKHGPILEQPPGYTGHVRDPKLWYDQEIESWWMIVGAQRVDRTGDLLAFVSHNLKDWTFKGSAFQFEQAFGYMWECPDLVFLQDQMTQQEKAVLVFSPQGIEPKGDNYHNLFNTTYLVGEWDHLHGQFIADEAEIDLLKELDRGFEYYAPQSFVGPDERVIQYAWMGTMWPEVEAAVPTRIDNWLHQLTLPRELSLKEGQLYQRPVSELYGLISESHSLVWPTEGGILPLKGPLMLDICFDATEDWVLVIDKSVKISFNYYRQLLRVERRNWQTQQIEYRQIELKDYLERLEIWLDSSSLECFINEGRYTMSLRYFAEAPIQQIALSALKDTQPRMKFNQLEAYQFKAE